MKEKTTQPDPIVEVKLVSFADGLVQEEYANLVIESALEVMINGRSHSLLMRLPGHDAELVVGYLFTEGLIENHSDIAGFSFSAGTEVLGAQGTRVLVELPWLGEVFEFPDRPALSLSSCGLCGKEALEGLDRGLSRVKSRQRFTWDFVFSLLEDLRNHQPLYKKTRGVHAVAMYRADGEFFCCYEDVGRHNALDKVIGRALMEGWSFDDKIIVLSGRASLEMVVKTARAGFPVLLCFSSPTFLAVEAAKGLNLTLVSRRNNKYLAAYTHTRRLITGE